MPLAQILGSPRRRSPTHEGYSRELPGRIHVVLVRQQVGF